MKIRRKIIEDKQGVAGIIVAVMIVGLVLAVISIIQTMYVPKWMEARESEHMANVADQFSQLKYAIDTQVALQQPLPISTSITLGSKELGFLMSNKAFGRLSIEDDGWAYFIQQEIGATFEGILGVLKYTSQNSYFLDQTFAYEVGGLVLNQTEGAVFTEKPLFSATTNSTTIPPRANLTLTCVNINPIGGKTSISGFGTYPIKTMFASSTTTDIPEINLIRITCYRPELWANFFNDTLQDAGLTYSADFTISRTINTVSMIFTTTYDFNIELTIKTIDSQIGPGWIE